ncbi:MAG TPA: hypothetical protein VGI74_20085 [Streptosporangiaceae bacterium]|jgi:hypothetical protein
MSAAADLREQREQRLGGLRWIVVAGLTGGQAVIATRGEPPVALPLAGLPAGRPAHSMSWLTRGCRFSFIINSG